jgi:hypothetical protein
MKNIKNIIFGNYLTFRHFYLVSFVITTAAFLFSAVFLINDYVKFKSDISYDLRIHNERIEQKFTDSLFYTKLIMSYVGRQVSNHDNLNDYKFISNVLNNYRMPENGLMSWSILSWINKDDDIAVSRGIGIVKEKISLSHRDYIKLTKKYSEVIHLGRPIVGALSGLNIVPIGYGVVDTHRQYVGTVISGIVIKNLQSQIEEIIGNPDISFVLIDIRGEVVAKSVNNNFSDDLLQKVLNRVEKDGLSKFFYKNGYYKKLGEYPYIIGTIYNKGVISSSSQIRFSIYLMVAFLMLSFISLIFYGFHKKLISPISELSEFANKIYRGDENRKLPKFEVKEMNDLANTLSKIDDMISSNNKNRKK